MNVFIRRMESDDLDEVEEIEYITWPQYPWTAEDFIEASQPSTGNCWVLEDDKGLIGYSVQYIDADSSHIANICIRRERQQQGFGRMMLDYLINEARLSNAKYISLEVNVSNEKAYLLYKSFGFTVTERLKAYYSASEDAYKMQLCLTNADMYDYVS
ncbi:unnamed protein product [Didymodactylos carnosus]|uniref:N-acetyltransferase domain-containing protein n=1 Tax=Didymodactylos carnosus TaxID=1234261 RepID=A0A815VL96_9BILA|nr:unnamed protein product [Didymodactylos carnosus]CAF1534375.1 unnamed protein product [Didymodactylos carnosus]CAF4163944.1 unnamed protein product [Didymodactylos carnosus]CAF4394046.1 unnamed protein product [Didymodactylos carnosus]